MSGHGANSIFINRKNKDWTSRTLANPPPPYVRWHLIFTLLHPHPHIHPLKVNVICVSPLKHPQFSNVLTDVTAILKDVE